MQINGTKSQYIQITAIWPLLSAVYNEFVHEYLLFF